MTYQEMLQARAALVDRNTEIANKLKDAGISAEQIATLKAEFNSNKVKFDKMQDEIQIEETSRTMALSLAGSPASGQRVEVIGNPLVRPFRNLAEQLKAIKLVATTGRVDDRLTQISNAALGMNEGIDSEGGFPVQSDFAGMMLETAAKSGEILSRVDKYPIGDGANEAKWIEIDESSVASTVFGGVLVYWAAEAMTATATKPKLMERELKLEKLLGFAYATYELEQDTNFVSTLYTRAFEKAIQRELESCVVGGTGVGKFLGFLKSGCLVTVDKETGQAADTILYQNIVRMYNRAIDKTSPGLVWLLHPDVHEELDFMQFPVGTGGVPVYLQASSAGTLDSLKGKPILESDQCSAIGDVGDINCVDLGEYFLVYKGGIDQATSMHVQFLTAENCFRFIFRANGMPKKRTTLTIKNSSKVRSSFIALQAR